MEYPPIIGKKLEESDKKAARDYLMDERIRGKKRIEGTKNIEGEKEMEGEMHKNERDLVFIEKANEYINEEMERLGINRRVFIEPEQIHILPEDTFKAKASRTTDGRHNPYSGSILINFDHIVDTYKYSPPKLLQVIFHEMIHDAAHMKFNVAISDWGNEKKWRHYNAYRQGYANVSSTDTSHEHFRGFNEAVVDKLTDEIIRNKKKELSEICLIDDEEWDHLHENYQNQIIILNEIIEGTAKKTGQSETEVWDSIKKGYFDGSMMHLRDIERAYGKGSLRVLAAMDSGMKKISGMPRFYKEEQFEKLLKFFQTKDENKKNQIVHEILNERERLKYLRRKKQPE